MLFAFELISFYGSIFFAVIVAAILWLKKDKKLLFLFVLDFVLISTVVYGLKFLVQAPRPNAPVPLSPGAPVLPTPFYESSFPSGHSARAFLYSAFLSKEFDKFFQDILYIFAALAAIGRVVTGAHTAIEIIVGSVIGFAISWLTLKYQKQILKIFNIR